MSGSLTCLALLLLGPPSGHGPAAEGERTREPVAEPTRAVLLIPDAVAPSLRESIVGGVEAQFADVDTELGIEDLPGDRSSVVDVQARARREAETDPDTRLVFWPAVAADGSHEVHLVDPRRLDRVFVRTLAPPSASDSAVGENLALVVRRALATVLEGGELDSGATMTVIELDPGEPDVPAESCPEVPVCEDSPSAEDSPAPPERERDPYALQPWGQFRTTVAYTGGNFSADHPWRSSLALTFAWRHATGAQVGVGYSFTRAIQIDHDEFVVVLERHPLEVFAGYRAQWSRLTVGADVGAMVDVTSQTVSSKTNRTITASAARTVAAVVPRVDVGYALLPSVWLVASGAVEILPGNLEYEADVDGIRTSILRPARFRAQLRAGLAFSF